MGAWGWIVCVCLCVTMSPSQRDGQREREGWTERWIGRKREREGGIKREERVNHTQSEGDTVSHTQSQRG